MHTGLLCKHSILVAVDRINEYREDSEGKQRVCEAVVSFCNSNWKRKTYDHIPTIHVYPTPKLSVGRDEIPQEIEFLSRFRDVIQYLETDTIERYLREMEDLIVQPVPSRERGKLPPTIESTSSDSDVKEFSNPPRRRKRKLVFQNVKH